MSWRIHKRPVGRGRLLVVTVIALLTWAVPAHAAFPGANGKIAFTSGPQIYAINPDGTGLVQLTHETGSSNKAAWSPDGQRIAFETKRDDPNPMGCSPCNWEIYVMDADGANQTRLTNDAGADLAPTWSPDGTKIAFNSNRTGSQNIYSMNADGSGLMRLTSGQFDQSPAWSPDGTKIAFRRWDPATSDFEIATMSPDGGNQVDLTNTPDYSESSPDWSPDGRMIVYSRDDCAHYDTECISYYGGLETIYTMHSDGTQQSRNYFPAYVPAWSPDGTRIAIAQQGNCTLYPFEQCRSSDLVTMNPDGSAQTNLTNNPSGTRSSGPSWQPIPYTGFSRPRGATPFLTYLVPAFRQCSAPNDTHGAPLAFQSCNPPEPTSSYVTVGTPDSNGLAASSRGSVQYTTLIGGPTQPADMKIDARVTGVLDKTSLTPYSGELSATVSVRITDRNNAPSPAAATMVDIPFPVTVPCDSSSCSVSTSANAVTAGTISAGQRSIWQLGRVQVYDGGADGLVSTSDNTLFMDQGLFIP